MNLDELNRVFKVLAHCDNGCSRCVNSIFRYFEYMFPEYADLAEKYYCSDWEWWHRQMCEPQNVEAAFALIALWEVEA